MKYVRKIRLLVFCLVLVTCFSSTIILAESYNCNVSIPVHVNQEGSSNIAELILESKNNAPMPKESTINLKGDAVGNFGPIEFLSPGIYEYKVYQKKHKVDNIIYDKTEFDVQINVFNAKNGRLESKIIVYPNKSDKKTELFIHNKRININTNKNMNQTNSENYSIFTGDNANILLWIILGLLAITLLIVLRRKEKN